MTPLDPASDVLVAGGGPAAATAARLLASWGRRVHLMARPAGAGEPELPEALTPSCGKFFDLMGIRGAVDAAGFVHSRGHTVWWGSPEPRVEPFADGLHGWQVTSGRLGRLMLEAAAASGCRVEAGSVTAEEALAWPATFCLDGTGRAGLLARPHGQRRYEPGHRTVALVGRWRSPGGWPLDDPTHTLLESYADGWAWSVPLDVEDRAIAVMVDPKTTALSRGDGPEGVYLAEIGKTSHLKQLTDGGVLTGGPWGWDASMYAAERPAGETWLLIGDAASFIDPLSSAGVKKAMASGWLAAVAVNTALADPRRKDMAFAFYAARENDTYAQFLALTRQHLLDGAASRHPFWAERGTAAPPAADEGPSVQAALDRLRAADDLALRIADGVRFEARPALTEREIVLERQLVTTGTGEGVRYLHGVDVVALVELAPTVRQVPDLFDVYTSQSGQVDWPSFLTTLATAMARGWLGRA
jgi:flavin-dependent dehydrogenase